MPMSKWYCQTKQLIHLYIQLPPVRLIFALRFAIISKHPPDIHQSKPFHLSLVRCMVEKVFDLGSGIQPIDVLC